METEYLIYFKKIAETENMSKAAKLLNISQPSLSRTLKRLEEEFGCPLFNRNGKSLKLNVTGEILLDYTNQILPLLSQAHSDIQRLSNAPQSISLYLLYCNQIFPQLLADFSKNHPNIQLNLTRFENEATLNSNYDIVIHSSDTFSKEHNSIKILEEECLIGISAKHPYANYDDIPLDLLAKEKFIILNRENILGQITLQFFKNASISPQIVMECDNQSTISSFVALNIGIAIFPSLTWLPHDDSIVYKKIKGIEIKRNIYLSSLHNHRSSAAKFFTNYAVQYITKLNK